MKKILIVEDDPKISLALSVRLKAQGYEVSTADNAISATSAASKAQPDLLLLDISMPGGNGFMAVELLQRNDITADIPFIFLTASKQPGLREKALELGASAFFEKPYDAEQLLAAVEQALPSSPA